MIGADSIMFFWVYFSDLPQSKWRVPGTVSKVAVSGNLMSLALASFWEPVTSAQRWLAHQPGPLALGILIEYWYHQNTPLGFSPIFHPRSLAFQFVSIHVISLPTHFQVIRNEGCVTFPSFRFINTSTCTNTSVVVVFQTYCGKYLHVDSSLTMTHES